MFGKMLGTILTVALTSAVAATSAHAQVARSQPQAHVTASAKLRAEAKVTEDAARTAALKQVPTGKIQSGELEREKGKLIYSFDIKVAGKAGIEEVNVDAITGAVIAHVHETPQAEKAEAAKEAREKKAARRS